jgi:hypothetical protein
VFKSSKIGLECLQATAPAVSVAPGTRPKLEHLAKEAQAGGCQQHTVLFQHLPRSTLASYFLPSFIVTIVNPTNGSFRFLCDLFSSNGIEDAILVQDNTHNSHLPPVSMTKIRENSDSSMLMLSSQGDGFDQGKLMTKSVSSMNT